MSVTIDSLDIQIRSSAGSAAANIDRLAEALGRMRSNAKLTAVTNNLNKLSEALGKLQGASTGLSNIRGLAGAMKSLSQVQKSAGFNSLVNTLKKLPDIVNQLDASTLSLFTSRMRQLAAALAPLASQIDKVGVAFSRLPARVSQIVTGTNRMAAASRDAAAAQDDHNDSLNAMSINLAAGIANIQSFLGVLHQVRDALVSAISTAIEWDGIQFRFGQSFGEDAQEVYDWILKINESLGISVQEFMQNSGMYASLLKGFGVEQDKASEIALGLTELTYDIWAFNNDRYKQLEDAAEAVRSAITGEIEPIRNAGIALTEASMQEYLDSLGMAHVSVEKLTEAQKAEVRYAVMVNSAMSQGIVGTYAREMDTAEGSVRRLTQQLKTLIQAFGSLFIPILQKVIPWITAFVSILTDAVHWVAALFGIKITAIDWSKTTSGVGDLASGAKDANSALGGAAAAAKKLKTYTMGFDELNVIDPPSDSASGGGGGGAAGGAGGNGFPGLELESLWDQALLDSASKKVDEIKQKILDFFEKWKTQIQIIAAALAALSLSKLLGHLGQALGLGQSFLNVMSTIGKFATTAIIVTVQYSLMTEFLGDFMGEDGTFWDYVKAMLVGAGASWILYSMWGPAGLVIGLGVTAVASLSAVIEAGGITDVESATVALTGLATAAGAVAIAWKKVAPAIQESNIVRVLQGIRDGSPAASSALSFMFPTITKLVGFFKTAATTVVSFVSGISAPVWAAIAAAIAAVVSVAYFLSKNWEEVTDAVKGFFKTNIVPKLESIKESWNRMKDALSSVLPPAVLQWFKDAGKWIGDLVKKIGDWFKSVDWLKGIGKAFEWIGGILFSVFSGALAGAISAVIGVIDGLIQTFSGVIQVVTGIVEFFTALFTGGDLEKPIKQIADGIVNIFVGLYKSTIGVVVEFVKGIIDWFTELWDELVGHSIVPDMVEAIIDWFLSLPDKILQPIKNFCADVKQFFVDLWDGIKSWWNSNVAPKFTAEYWKNKFNVIKEAIASKLNEVKQTATEKWEAIKSWFSTNIAPKFTLDYWKNKFGVMKTAIASKLDEFKQAVIEKWNSVKEWFTANIAPKFTLSFWLDKFKNLKAGFTQTIKNAVNAGIDLMNKFIGWINDKLGFSWDAVTIAGKEIVPAGNIQLFTIPKIPHFETGGFLEDGLFTMNHGEIAGKFNNGKSVVANNQQIVEGIAAGVYEAVVAAMNATNGRQDQSVNVYLDGKQIYASVKKTESERGKNLMGNQLGYMY